MEAENRQKKDQENLFFNLAFNLLIPITLLSKGSDWLNIDAKWNLMVALSFPLGYGIWDKLSKKKWNFLSILGLISIMTKGSIGFFELNKDWVAINEAALPLIFGLAVLFSLKREKPLVKTLLYTDQVFDTHKIERLLQERGNESHFEHLLKKCTWLIAASFLLSAILNYVVAKVFIHTNPATDLLQFNKELGAMQGWSYLFIMLPSSIVTFYALWVLIKGIKNLTGLSFEDCMIAPAKKES